MSKKSKLTGWAAVATTVAFFGGLAIAGCESETSGVRAGQASRSLGIVEFRGEQTEAAASFEMIDGGGAVVGSYEWELTADGELTAIELDDHAYEMRVAYQGEWTVAIDGVELATFDLAPGAQHAVEGPEAVALEHALRVFSATQPDVDVGALSSEHGDVEYGTRVCVSISILGMTYEYCFELPSGNCLFHESTVTPSCYS